MIVGGALANLCEPFVNVLGFYLAAVALRLFTPQLRGWKLALVPLATPLLDAASMGFTGLPSAIVINSDVPNAVVQAGGIATILIALAVVRGTTPLLAKEPRFALEGLAVAR